MSSERRKPRSASKDPPRARGKGAAKRLNSDTRQRIVLASIELFNRYGPQNVPIDRIAADLDISPGNLTYHFKFKVDLISAALEVVKDRLRFALQRPVEVTSATEGAEYLVRLFRTFWECRFFFNSLAHLSTDDRELLSEYSQLSRWVVRTMESDIAYLAEQKYFRPPVAPNSFALLAENIWGLLLNWLRMAQIEGPRSTAPPNTALYEVALHLWSLCQLWMAPAFAAELLRIFQSVLSRDSVGAAGNAPARGRRAADNLASD